MADPVPIGPVGGGAYSLRRLEIMVIGDPYRHTAADGYSLIGSPLVAPAPLTITAAIFSCGSPSAAARPNIDLWTFLMRVQPAGGGAASDVVKMPLDMNNWPKSGWFTTQVPLPAPGIALAVGDSLACAVGPTNPGGPGPLALDCPGVSLTWTAP